MAVLVLSLLGALPKESEKESRLWLPRWCSLRKCTSLSAWKRSPGSAAAEASTSLRNGQSCAQSNPIGRRSKFASSSSGAQREKRAAFQVFGPQSLTPRAAQKTWLLFCSLSQEKRAREWRSASNGSRS